MANRVWLFADGSQAEARVVAWQGPVPALKAWFKAKEDIHSNVAKLIACVIQENHLTPPSGLFVGKHWRAYGKGDPERETSKTNVHASNYGIGDKKRAIQLKLPLRDAQLIGDIYFSLFPEIKTNYQAGLKEQVDKYRMFWNPYGFRYRVYGRIDDDAYRKVWSLFAQTTVGDWMGDTLNGVVEHFKPLDVLPTMTPSAIATCGLDFRLQIHDAIGVCVDDDAQAIREAAQIIRHYGERPFKVRGEDVVIPVDFKVGRSWGDARDYKLSD